MRGGSEKGNNAYRIANALKYVEEAYQMGMIDEVKIEVMAKILSYDKSQLLDDMHDLREYIADLEKGE